jgi:hypothetical protein
VQAPADGAYPEFSPAIVQIRKAGSDAPPDFHVTPKILIRCLAEVVDSSTTNVHFARGGATICPTRITKENIGLSILGKRCWHTNDHRLHLFDPRSG